MDTDSPAVCDIRFPVSEDEADGTEGAEFHRVDDGFAPGDLQFARHHAQAVAVVADVDAYPIIATEAVDAEIGFHLQRYSVAADDAHVGQQAPRARTRV